MTIGKLKNLINAFLLTGWCVSCLGIILLTSRPASAQVQTLDSLSIGSVIRITGQGGADYRFIKLTPFNDDGTPMPHSDGTSGSYWMLADNYCSLVNTPTSCVDSTGTANANWQAWNNTNNNNWMDMVDNGTNGVFQRVLMPMFNDLPSSIGGLPRNQAILTMPFPMSPMTAVQSTSSSPSGCYLTPGINVDLTNCTWTGQISLPSYADWQTDISNNVDGFGQFNGTNADVYARARTATLSHCGSAGCSWAAPPSAFNAGFNWQPWLRSPYASDMAGVWFPYGGNAAHSVGDSGGGASNGNGVSPVIWLSSSLSIDGSTGDGTYSNPYLIFAYVSNSIGNTPGAVINIPINNTPVPWVISDYNDQGYTMVMAMTNICTLPGNPAGCDTTTGTAWSSANSNTNPTYFTQMNNIWNVLGDSNGNIAGQPRANLVLNTIWNMDGFSSATNPPTRTAGYNPPIAMHINLASYFEWQAGFDDGVSTLPVNANWNNNPLPNSLGSRFCHARYGTTACMGTNLWQDYNRPWLRSALSSSTGDSWLLSGSATDSVSNSWTLNTLGLLPVIWMSSDLTLFCGAGTYDDPFEIDQNNCPPIHNSVSYGNLLLPVQSFIGLDCQDSVNLEEIQSFGASTMQFYCSVLSNNATGYEIQISTVAMTNPSSSDTIVPMNDTPAVLNNPNVAQWGLTNFTSSVTVDDNVWFGSGTITSVNLPTSYLGNLHSYKVGTSIGGNAMIEPGTYTGQITITASHI